MITSRYALTGLGDTGHLLVHPLGPEDSVELLRATAGAERITPDIPAAEQIADLLGHLPLALSVIGRHMHSHPTWALGDYYREPLISLALEDGVRTALSASDAQLPTGARRLLRLLALHPLQEIDTCTAAALLDEPTTATEQHLATLTTAHLIKCATPGRFRLHPLVHAYAEERICIDEPATRIRRALGRLLEHGRRREAAIRPETRTLRTLRLPIPPHAAADDESTLPPQLHPGRYWQPDGHASDAPSGRQGARQDGRGGGGFLRRAQEHGDRERQAWPGLARPAFDYLRYLAAIAELVRSIIHWLS